MLIALVLIAAQLFAFETEKVFQGKNLQQWVKELDSDPEVARKIVIISALGMFDLQALPVLEKLALNSDLEIRTKSISTLQQMGKTAVPTLAKISTNGPKGVRLLALTAIAGLGEDAVVALAELCILTEHFDKDTKLRALAALGTLGTQGYPALPFLIDSFQSPERDIAELALRSMAQVCGWGNNQPGGDLIEVSMKLAPAKGEPGVLVLAKLLKNTDAAVRIRAANLLGGMGAKAIKAMPELQAALQDKNEKVIDAAFDAILKIKP
ncbi:MAG: HEAT repeat domain-containing protein [Planctomycetota bacterium]